MPTTIPLAVQSLPARERILQTAHTLFYRDGIRATGIDRVISESGVTKVTFYRHFPSKSDLILAFLDYRHQRWMAWFTDALQRYGGNAGALIPALAEWFGADHFRGCAFINSVGELGPSLPGVVEMAQRHKHDMMVAIANVLVLSEQREAVAQAMALAVDGAIIRVQMDGKPDAALQALQRVLQSLLAS
ncbi:hypothetical protein MIZ03_3344 [Rhodoferax lithotrophicus]|uniref:HTH tetR-type domain-containing protein n=1 Tax=Rhodoferax lithotrophicus TaxID=2798804 RepID=A0ABM7MQ15_9BURK|nr:TetR/AcrR family transcriptional regulator [Rhodoferax sp. MIZ03]BCO28444.1 hypothetical protein MIZ03_3344 [Rhodoferax sp. MIZ03]